MKALGLYLVLSMAALPWCRSFTPPLHHLAPKWPPSTGASSPLPQPPLRDASSPLDEFDDERKANLFRFLLRDLQVEGVPLLEVDAEPQDQILQAVLWTTMAELSEPAMGQKACLVFEQFDVQSLQTFTDFFAKLKEQQDGVMAQLPELDRFQVGLVGKGVGPAILIEAANAAESIDAEMESHQDHEAMQDFMDQTAFKTEPDSAKLAVTYRSSPLGDACQIMMSFWNLICEMMAASDAESSSAVLTMPLLSSNQFEAITELLNGSLSLHSFDDDLELHNFHPEYHLGDNDEQLRSPLPAVWIKRKSR